MFCGVWSGSALFANYHFYGSPDCNGLVQVFQVILKNFNLQGGNQVRYGMWKVPLIFCPNYLKSNVAHSYLKGKRNIHINIFFLISPQKYMLWMLTSWKFLNVMALLMNIHVMFLQKIRKNTCRVLIGLDKCGFQINIFLFLHENICCGYSLEAARRGTSNEYHQHMFLWRNKKNIKTFGLKTAFYQELWTTIWLKKGTWSKAMLICLLLILLSADRVN